MTEYLMAIGLLLTAIGAIGLVFERMGSKSLKGLPEIKLPDPPETTTTTTSAGWSLSRESPADRANREWEEMQRKAKS